MKVSNYIASLKERVRQISPKSGVNIVVFLIGFSFILSGLSSFVLLLKNSTKDCFFSIQNKCLDEEIKAYIKNFATENNIKVEDREMVARIVNKKVSDEILKVIANDLRIAISDDYILENIKNDNLFKENGSFNREKFDKFLKDNNLTEKKYFQEMRSFITNHIISSLFYSENKNSSLSEFSPETLEFYKKKYFVKTKEYFVTEYYKDLKDINVKKITDEDIVKEYEKLPATFLEVKKAKFISIKNGDKINFRGGIITVDKDNIISVKEYVEEKISNENLSFFEKKFKLKAENCEFYNQFEAMNTNSFDRKKLEKNKIYQLESTKFTSFGKKDSFYLVDFNSEEGALGVYYYISTHTDIKLPFDMLDKEYVKQSIEKNFKNDIIDKAFKDKDFKFFQKKEKIIKNLDLTDTSLLDDPLLIAIKDNEARNIDKVNDSHDAIFLRKAETKQAISFFFLNKVIYNNSITDQNLLSFIKAEKEKETISMQQSYNNYIYNKYNVVMKFKN